MFFFSGGVAPGTPSAAMIMEGLETLVAPSHHAFLLTESAAAAHFNVLSFDTCLFKTTAQTSPSTAVTSATTYLTTPSSFAGTHLGAQTLLHYNISSNTNITNNSAAATSPHQSNTNSVLSAAISRTSRLSSTTPTTSQPNQIAAASSNSAAVTSASIETNSSSSSGRNSAHLSLLNTTQHSPCGSIAGDSGVGNDSVSANIKCGEAQLGDLNTPVTTSSDIPSFFGPSTVVEPPPITGKILKIYYC